MISHGREYVYAPRFACTTPRLADIVEEIPQRYTALKIGAANFSETLARMYQNTCTWRYVRRLSDYAVHIWTTN
jgi:hypothetical protein